MKTPEIFIHNVEQVLKDRGLSKKALADKLGIKPSGVAKILKENSNPQLGTLIAIAKVLKIPLHKLFIDHSNPWVERIAELSEELREIEFGKSEKRIEVNILKNFIIDHDPEDKKSLEYKIQNLQTEIVDRDRRQTAIYQEIQELDRKISSLSKAEETAYKPVVPQDILEGLSNLPHDKQDMAWGVIRSMISSLGKSSSNKEDAG